MAAVDDFSDWVSDTESVAGDEFNKAQFKEAAKPTFTTDAATTTQNAVSKKSKHKSKHSKRKSKNKKHDRKSQNPKKALDLEREDTKAAEELEQARDLSKLHNATASGLPGGPVSAIGKKPSFGSFKGPPVVPNLEAEEEEVTRKVFGDNIVEFFNKANKESFTQQAISYLNAYWEEIGDQAEWIFSVAMPIFREADMHRQGITLRHLYEEGCDVDYPTYLYFYEKLCAYVSKHKKWRHGEWIKSAVYEVKTAVKHKNDLKAKVDVNFDGRISFLEFLLYQYNNHSNPVDYVSRMEKRNKKHPEILKAEQALAEVNQRIKEYEVERDRLEQGSLQDGVKGLSFKHQLSMLDSGPLAERLNEALIHAEAAVRIAVRRFLGKGAGVPGKNGAPIPQGSLWWLQRELEEKKKVTVPATLRRIRKDRGYA